jgi:hypothetical protein
MAVYLKKFGTHSEYDTYINSSDARLPNVSICTTEGDVHYNPSSPVPPTPSHDYVEIGGLKWATMNVGANSITDTGLYFQWGDISGYTASQVGSGEGQKYFGWTDYKYSINGSSGSFSKYTCWTKNVLDIEDDAATANWGNKWRMPTATEFNTLSAATTNRWVTDYNGSGVNGILLTDKTDNTKTLFFPAGGNCYDGSVYNVGSDGSYWSSSLFKGAGDDSRGIYMGFYSNDISWNSNIYRKRGSLVRGVLDE